MGARCWLPTFIVRSIHSETSVLAELPAVLIRIGDAPGRDGPMPVATAASTLNGHGCLFLSNNRRNLKKRLAARQCHSRKRSSGPMPATSSIRLTLAPSRTRWRRSRNSPDAPFWLSATPPRRTAASSAVLDDGGMATNRAGSGQASATPSAQRAAWSFERLGDGGWAWRPCCCSSGSGILPARRRRRAAGTIGLGELGNAAVQTALERTPNRRRREPPRRPIPGGRLFHHRRRLALPPVQPLRWFSGQQCGCLPTRARPGQSPLRSSSRRVAATTCLPTAAIRSAPICSGLGASRPLTEPAEKELLQGSP